MPGLRFIGLRANNHVSYNQDHPDYSWMGSLLGIILNYKRDPYVHCYGPLNELNELNIDSSSIYFPTTCT